MNKGETRIVRKFLILPRKFGNDFRWMEYVDILEEVQEVYDAEFGIINVWLEWVEVGFAFGEELIQNESI